MKTCLRCGSMISPHPYHKDEMGLCDDCKADDEKVLGFAPGTFGRQGIDQNRPKKRGKHLVMEKTPAEREIEQRQRDMKVRRRFY